MIRQLLAEGFEPRISAKRHQRRVRFWPHCIVTKTLRSRRRHDIAGAKSTFVYREPEDPHPRVKVIPIVKVSESEDEDGNTGGLRAVCMPGTGSGTKRRIMALMEAGGACPRQCRRSLYSTNSGRRLPRGFRRYTLPFCRRDSRTARARQAVSPPGCTSVTSTGRKGCTIPPTARAGAPRCA